MENSTNVYKKRRSSRINWGKTLVLLLVILFMSAMAVTFIVVFRPSQTVIASPLLTPANVKVTETGEQYSNDKTYVLSFDKVQNADYYALYIFESQEEIMNANLQGIDNIEPTTTFASTVLSVTKYLKDAGKYYFSVRAMYNRIPSYSSEASDPYGCRVDVYHYMDAPETMNVNLDRTNNVYMVTWDVVDNATGYLLDIIKKVDKESILDEQISVVGNSYVTSIDIVTLMNDEYEYEFEFVVQPTNSNEFIVSNPNNKTKSADAYTYKEIEAPEISYTNEDGIYYLHWTPVAYAKQYQIYFIYNGFTTSTTFGQPEGVDSQIDFNMNPCLAGGDEITLQLGEYEIYIIARNDSEYVADSVQSNHVSFMVTGTTPKVSGVEFIRNGNQLMIIWNDSGLTINHKITLKDEYGTIIKPLDQVKDYAEVKNDNTFSFDLTLNTKGYYDITIVSQYDGFFDESSGYHAICEYETLELPVPTNLAFDDRKLLSWEVNDISVSRNYYDESNECAYLFFAPLCRDDISKYNVYIYTDEECITLYKNNIIELEKDKNTKKASYDLSDLPAGHIYYIKVESCPDAGMSTMWKTGKSEAQKCVFTKQLTAPVLEIVDEGTGVSEDNPILSWNKIENATSYIVTIGGEGISNTTINIVKNEHDEYVVDTTGYIVNLSEDSFTLSGINTYFSNESLTTGTYTFTVRALADVDDEVFVASGPSDEVVYNFVRKLNAPDGVKVEQSSNKNTAKLYWYKRVGGNEETECLYADGQKFDVFIGYLDKGMNLNSAEDDVIVTTYEIKNASINTINSGTYELDITQYLYPCNNNIVYVSACANGSYGASDRSYVGNAVYETDPNSIKCFKYEYYLGDVYNTETNLPYYVVTSTNGEGPVLQINFNNIKFANVYTFTFFDDEEVNVGEITQKYSNNIITLRMLRKEDGDTNFADWLTEFGETKINVTLSYDNTIENEYLDTIIDVECVHEYTYETIYTDNYRMPGVGNLSYDYATREFRWTYNSTALDYITSFDYSYSYTAYAVLGAQSGSWADKTTKEIEGIDYHYGTIDFEYGGEVTITITPKTGEGRANAPSSSGTFTVICQLANPTNIEIIQSEGNTTAQWTAVQNAETYYINVFKNGSPIKELNNVTTTSVDLDTLSELVLDNYCVLKVIIKANSHTPIEDAPGYYTYAESGAVESENFVFRPTLGEVVITVDQENKTLTIQKIEFATTYEIYCVKKGSETAVLLDEISVNDYDEGDYINCDLTDYFNTDNISVGEYEIYVKAIANWLDDSSSTKDSNKCDYKFTKQFDAITINEVSAFGFGSVENETINEFTISFNKVVGLDFNNVEVIPNSYEIVVRNYETNTIVFTININYDRVNGVFTANWGSVTATNYGELDIADDDITITYTNQTLSNSEYIVSVQVKGDDTSIYFTDSTLVSERFICYEGRIAAPSLGFAANATEALSILATNTDETIKNLYITCPAHSDTFIVSIRNIMGDEEIVSDSQRVDAEGDYRIYTIPTLTQKGIYEVSVKYRNNATYGESEWSEPVYFYNALKLDVNSIKGVEFTTPNGGTDGNLEICISLDANVWVKNGALLDEFADFIVTMATTENPERTGNGTIIAKEPKVVIDTTNNLVKISYYCTDAGLIKTNGLWPSEALTYDVYFNIQLNSFNAVSEFGGESLRDIHEGLLNEFVFDIASEPYIALLNLKDTTPDVENIVLMEEKMEGEIKGKFTWTEISGATYYYTYYKWDYLGDSDPYTYYYNVSGTESTMPLFVNANTLYVSENYKDENKLSKFIENSNNFITTSNSYFEITDYDPQCAYGIIIYAKVGNKTNSNTIRKVLAVAKTPNFTKDDITLTATGANVYVTWKNVFTPTGKFGISGGNIDDYYELNINNNQEDQGLNNAFIDNNNIKFPYSPTGKQSYTLTIKPYSITPVEIDESCQVIQGATYTNTLNAPIVFNSAVTDVSVTIKDDRTLTYTAQWKQVKDSSNLNVATKYYLIFTNKQHDSSDLSVTYNGEKWVSEGAPEGQPYFDIVDIKDCISKVVKGDTCYEYNITSIVENWNYNNHISLWVCVADDIIGEKTYISAKTIDNNSNTNFYKKIRLNSVYDVVYTKESKILSFKSEYDISANYCYKLQLRQNGTIIQLEKSMDWLTISDEECQAWNDGCYDVAINLKTLLDVIPAGIYQMSIMVCPTSSGGKDANSNPVDCKLVNATKLMLEYGTFNIGDKSYVIYIGNDEYPIYEITADGKEHETTINLNSESITINGTTYNGVNVLNQRITIEGITIERTEYISLEPDGFVDINNDDANEIILASGSTFIASPSVKYNSKYFTLKTVLPTGTERFKVEIYNNATLKATQIFVLSDTAIVGVTQYKLDYDFDNGGVYTFNITALGNEVDQCYFDSETKIEDIRKTVYKRLEICENLAIGKIESGDPKYVEVSYDAYGSVTDVKISTGISLVDKNYSVYCFNESGTEIWSTDEEQTTTNNSLISIYNFIIKNSDKMTFGTYTIKIKYLDDNNDDYILNSDLAETTGIEYTHDWIVTTPQLVDGKNTYRIIDTAGIKTFTINGKVYTIGEETVTSGGISYPITNTDRVKTFVLGTGDKAITYTILESFVTTNNENGFVSIEYDEEDYVADTYIDIIMIGPTIDGVLHYQVKYDGITYDAYVDVSYAHTTPYLPTYTLLKTVTINDTTYTSDQKFSVNSNLLRFNILDYISNTENIVGCYEYNVCLKEMYDKLSPNTLIQFNEGDGVWLGLQTYIHKDRYATKNDKWKNDDAGDDLLISNVVLISDIDTNGNFGDDHGLLRWNFTDSSLGKASQFIIVVNGYTLSVNYKPDTTVYELNIRNYLFADIDTNNNYNTISIYLTTKTDNGVANYWLPTYEFTDIKYQYKIYDTYKIVINNVIYQYETNMPSDGIIYSQNGYYIVADNYIYNPTFIWTAYLDYDRNGLGINIYKNGSISFDFKFNEVYFTDSRLNAGNDVEFKLVVTKEDAKEDAKVTINQSKINDFTNTFNFVPKYKASYNLKMHDLIVYALGEEHSWVQDYELIAGIYTFELFLVENTENTGNIGYHETAILTYANQTVLSSWKIDDVEIIGDGLLPNGDGGEDASLEMRKTWADNANKVVQLEFKVNKINSNMPNAYIVEYYYSQIGDTYTKYGDLEINNIVSQRDNDTYETIIVDVSGLFNTDRDGNKGILGQMAGYIKFRVYGKAKDGIANTSTQYTSAESRKSLLNYVRLNSVTSCESSIINGSPKNANVTWEWNAFNNYTFDKDNTPKINIYNYKNGSYSGEMWGTDTFNVIGNNKDGIEVVGPDGYNMYGFKYSQALNSFNSMDLKLQTSKEEGEKPNYLTFIVQAPDSYKFLLDSKPFNYEADLLFAYSAPEYVAIHVEKDTNGYNYVEESKSKVSDCNYNLSFRILDDCFSYGEKRSCYVYVRLLVKDGKGNKVNGENGVIFKLNFNNTESNTTKEPITSVNICNISGKLSVDKRDYKGFIKENALIEDKDDGITRLVITEMQLKNEWLFGDKMFDIDTYSIELKVVDPVQYAKTIKLKGKEYWFVENAETTTLNCQKSSYKIIDSRWFVVDNVIYTRNGNTITQRYEVKDGSVFNIDGSYAISGNKIIAVSDLHEICPIKDGKFSMNGINYNIVYSGDVAVFVEDETTSWTIESNKVTIKSIEYVVSTTKVEETTNKWTMNADDTIEINGIKYNYDKANNKFTTLTEDINIKTFETSNAKNLKANVNFNHHIRLSTPDIISVDIVDEEDDNSDNDVVKTDSYYNATYIKYYTDNNGNIMDDVVIEISINNISSHSNGIQLKINKDVTLDDEKSIYNGSLQFRYEVIDLSFRIGNVLYTINGNEIIQKYVVNGDKFTIDSKEYNIYPNNKICQGTNNYDILNDNGVRCFYIGEHRYIIEYQNEIAILVQDSSALSMVDNKFAIDNVNYYYDSTYNYIYKNCRDVKPELDKNGNLLTKLTIIIDKNNYSNVYKIIKSAMPTKFTFQVQALGAASGDNGKFSEEEVLVYQKGGSNKASYLSSFPASPMDKEVYKELKAVNSELMIDNCTEVNNNDITYYINLVTQSVEGVSISSISHPNIYVYGYNFCDTPKYLMQVTYNDGSKDVYKYLVFTKDNYDDDGIAFVVNELYEVLSDEMSGTMVREYTITIYTVSYYFDIGSKKTGNTKSISDILSENKYNKTNSGSNKYYWLNQDLSNVSNESKSITLYFNKAQTVDNLTLKENNTQGGAFDDYPDFLKLNKVSYEWEESATDTTYIGYILLLNDGDSIEFKSSFNTGSTEKVDLAPYFNNEVSGEKNFGITCAGNTYIIQLTPNYKVTFNGIEYSVRGEPSADAYQLKFQLSHLRKLSVAYSYIDLSEIKTGDAIDLSKLDNTWKTRLNTAQGSYSDNVLISAVDVNVQLNGIRFLKDNALVKGVTGVEGVAPIGKVIFGLSVGIANKKGVLEWKSVAVSSDENGFTYQNIVRALNAYMKNNNKPGGKYKIKYELSTTDNRYLGSTQSGEYEFIYCSLYNISSINLEQTAVSNSYLTFNSTPIVLGETNNTYKLAYGFQIGQKSVRAGNNASAVLYTLNGATVTAKNVIADAKLKVLNVEQLDAFTMPVSASSYVTDCIENHYVYCDGNTYKNNYSDIKSNLGYIQLGKNNITVNIGIDGNPEPEYNLKFTKTFDDVVYTLPASEFPSFSGVKADVTIGTGFNSAKLTYKKKENGIEKGSVNISVVKGNTSKEAFSSGLFSSQGVMFSRGTMNNNGFTVTGNAEDTSSLSVVASGVEVKMNYYLQSISLSYTKTNLVFSITDFDGMKWTAGADEVLGYMTRTLTLKMSEKMEGFYKYYIQDKKNSATLSSNSNGSYTFAVDRGSRSLGISAKYNIEDIAMDQPRGTCKTFKGNGDIEVASVSITSSWGELTTEWRPGLFSSTCIISQPFSWTIEQKKNYDGCIFAQSIMFKCDICHKILNLFEEGSTKESEYFNTTGNGVLKNDGGITIVLTWLDSFTTWSKNHERTMNEAITVEPSVVYEIFNSVLR